MKAIIVLAACTCCSSAFGWGTNVLHLADGRAVTGDVTVVSGGVKVVAREGVMRFDNAEVRGLPAGMEKREKEERKKKPDVFAVNNLKLECIGYKTVYGSFLGFETVRYRYFFRVDAVLTGRRPFGVDAKLTGNGQGVAGVVYRLQREIDLFFLRQWFYIDCACPPQDVYTGGGDRVYGMELTFTDAKEGTFTRRISLRGIKRLGVGFE